MRGVNRRRHRLVRLPEATTRNSRRRHRTASPAGSTTWCRTRSEGRGRRRPRPAERPTRQCGPQPPEGLARKGRLALEEPEGGGDAGRDEKQDDKHILTARGTAARREQASRRQARSIRVARAERVLRRRSARVDHRSGAWLSVRWRAGGTQYSGLAFRSRR
jgi:hypothetical protein